MAGIQQLSQLLQPAAEAAVGSNDQAAPVRPELQGPSSSVSVLHHT